VWLEAPRRGPDQTDHPDGRRLWMNFRVAHALGTRAWHMGLRSLRRMPPRPASGDTVNRYWPPVRRPSHPCNIQRGGARRERSARHEPETGRQGV